MIIVSGTFEVDPTQRERFLAERRERMRTSRAEAGCFEYTFSADPLDADRVLLFERWASQDALDAHLAAPSSEFEVAAIRSSITLYDVAGERAFGG
jgi:quinol monooxygenase YgiN